MGFEIVYSFLEKKEESDDYGTEIKEMKKKVGEPFDEVDLIDVVKNIIKQRSRRDIFVKDVQVFEYKKTKLNFKETKGGIVIKHSKFLLDDDNIVVQDIKEVPAQVPATLTPTGTSMAAVPDTQTMALALVKQQNPGRPIKFVTLDPDIPTLHKVKEAKLAFTLDKRYPVFNQYPHKTEVGVTVYVMRDDYGREITVKDSYFVNADQVLSYGHAEPMEKRNGPKLSFENYENIEMPDIRG